MSSCWVVVKVFRSFIHSVQHCRRLDIIWFSEIVSYSSILVQPSRNSAQNRVRQYKHYFLPRISLELHDFIEKLQFV